MVCDKDVSSTGWYIGSYLVRFIELAERGNDDLKRQFLTWENTILIQAADLEEAYDKVVKVAKGNTRPYKGGVKGVDVQWIFEGVTELLPIYEKMEDGSEVMWVEYKRKLKNLRKRVRTKAQFQASSKKHA